MDQDLLQLLFQAASSASASTASYAAASVVAASAGVLIAGRPGALKSKTTITALQAGTGQRWVELTESHRALWEILFQSWPVFLPPSGFSSSFHYSMLQPNSQLLFNCLPGLWAGTSSGSWVRLNWKDVDFNFLYACMASNSFFSKNNQAVTLDPKSDGLPEVYCSLPCRCSESLVEVRVVAFGRRLEIEGVWQLLKMVQNDPTCWI